MPLFEYHCNKCDKIFETLVTDQNKVVSFNICNSESVNKVFSVFGVNSSRDNSSKDENSAVNSCNSSCCCCN